MVIFNGLFLWSFSIPSILHLWSFPMISVAVQRWTTDGIRWFTSIIGPLLDFQQLRLCRSDPMAQFFEFLRGTHLSLVSLLNLLWSIHLSSFIYLIDLHLIDLHLIDLHGFESIMNLCWDFFGYPERSDLHVIGRMIKCQYHPSRWDVANNLTMFRWFSMNIAT